MSFCIQVEIAVKFAGWIHESGIQEGAWAVDAAACINMVFNVLELSSLVYF